MSDDVFCSSMLYESSGYNGYDDYFNHITSLWIYVTLFIDKKNENVNDSDDVALMTTSLLIIIFTIRGGLISLCK